MCDNKLDSSELITINDLLVADLYRAYRLCEAGLYSKENLEIYKVQNKEMQEKVYQMLIGSIKCNYS